MRALQSGSQTTSILGSGQAALRQLERKFRRLRLFKCKFYLREKMRSRHASMSFIIGVEAKNIPKVQAHHSITGKKYDAFSTQIHF